MGHLQYGGSQVGEEDVLKQAEFLHLSTEVQDQIEHGILDGVLKQ